MAGGNAEAKARPMNYSVRYESMSQKLLAAMIALASASAASGSGITFVGVESGTPPDFKAQRWSLRTQPKELAVKNDIHGGSGHYVLAPGVDVHHPEVDPARIDSFGTIIRKPDFLKNHPRPVAGKWVNANGYYLVTKPFAANQADAFRIGGISVRVDASPDAEMLTSEAFSFELATDAEFRLGIMVDALDSGDYAPDFVSVRLNGSDDFSINAPALTRDRSPDLVLFDIKGKAGERYTISLHRKQSDTDVVMGFSLITFDRLSGEDSLPPPEKISAHIGEFSREGEYMKDYYLFNEGGTIHLFYNVGTASATQCWTEAGNEKAFGHATTKDLKNWEHHPRILHSIPGTWEGEVVSAPSILKHDGMYHMTYTGFDDRHRGMQTIGLATSKDLFHWERYEGNPVYRAPQWAALNPNGWEDCRDAHIIRHGDEFLMFTMVHTAKGEGAIALASSPDLKTWKDHGPAIITFEAPESPRVFEHNGTFYMFATSGHGRTLVKTRDPKSNKWEPVPFEWPAPGLWSGWEVVEFEGRTVFAAFLWKMDGNFIRFWDVEWDGDVPRVIYHR